MFDTVKFKIHYAQRKDGWLQLKQICFLDRANQVAHNSNKFQETQVHFLVEFLNSYHKLMEKETGERNGSGSLHFFYHVQVSYDKNNNSEIILFHKFFFFFRFTFLILNFGHFFFLYAMIIIPKHQKMLCLLLNYNYMKIC